MRGTAITQINGHIPVFGLELLGEVHGVVDEGEASGLSATKLGLEAKCEATVGCAGVHLSQLLPHLRKTSKTWCPGCLPVDSGLHFFASEREQPAIGNINY